MNIIWSETITDTTRCCKPVRTYFAFYHVIYCTSATFLTEIIRRQRTRPRIVHPRLQIPNVERVPHVHRQVEGLAHRQVKLQRLHFRGRVVRIAISQGLKLLSRFKIDNRDEVALGRNIERVTRRD